MTITIDNPWRLLVCMMLALVVLAFTLTAFVTTMWSWGEIGPVGKLVNVAVTATGVAGAVALVMAGGGWL